MVAYILYHPNLSGGWGGAVTGDSLQAAALPSIEHSFFNFTGVKHFSMMDLT